MEHRLAYSPAEVAEMIGLCRTTVFKLIREGKLDATRVGRRKLVTTEALREFLKPTGRGEGA